MKNSGGCWRWGPSAPQNLGNIPENPRENGAQPSLTSKHGAQGLQKITWMKTFFGGHSKRGLHDLHGREFVGKSCTKTFRGSLGKFGKKSFATPKISLLLNLWWKGTSTPVARLLKGQRDECPAMPPPSGVPVHIDLHALSLLVVVGYNEHKLYQRYPKTEPFITAKISGNALKQGSRTHSMLRQRSSQLQKYKAARMSRRIAVDQKVCGWDDGHPGLTVWNL